MLLSRTVRESPFSVMALCNIGGDLGYLGFAFAAQGWVSTPKLLGALFTIGAHVILLAHGDSRAQHIAHEKGVFAHFVLFLRQRAEWIVDALPQKAKTFICLKPVGLPFMMLALNGVGLLIDALLKPISIATVSQIVLGVCITVGCVSFALADFHPRQKTADILLRVAPVCLTGATVSNALVALATFNGFMIFATLMFIVSNYAGFYTKIDKKEPIPFAG